MLFFSLHPTEKSLIEDKQFLSQYFGVSSCFVSNLRDSSNVKVDNFFIKITKTIDFSKKCTGMLFFFGKNDQNFCFGGPKGLK